ncbi:MAG: hypothetical protein GXO74_08965 [Calditrichaeota bacterium]|nr:hypothetical protein [Calditrichota bacterium]
MTTEDPNEYSKRKFRGLIYIFLGIIGLGYELIFAESIRSLILVGYGVVILLGIFYFSFFRGRAQNFNKSN